MLSHIEQCANCFYYTATFPYKYVRAAHLEDSILKRPSILSFSLHGSVLLSFLSLLHISQVTYTLNLRLPMYLENGEFLRLTFHGGWILCWALIFSQNMAPLFISQEMVQLSYGAANLSTVIEKSMLLSEINF